MKMVREKVKRSFMMKMGELAKKNCRMRFYRFYPHFAQVRK